MNSTAKRTYRSPRREAQARATRAAIVGAAIKLFGERGYASTTMQAIAAEAGVAVESVYAAGSKSELLRLAVDQTTVGDDEPVPLAERPEYRHILTAPSQREQIRRFAEFGAVISRRVVPIDRAFFESSARDEQQAARWLEIERMRRQDLRTFVDALAAHGPLRHGMTVDTAATTAWLGLNWYNVWLMRADLGCTDTEVAAWMERMLADLLLP
ncbi:TetR/AcrR family transcriptional regulator [Virgisporangium aurantiacum]|uniref:DNA-binding protein n=1 Tax=Virgisporangium aurantiacum TaxID=175570 RepID=A0A8J3ZI42_9ACTN|nr:TetR/AcrR family transcriptional regulator [Virgisporangium aurantiacum]GIJ64532.1 DNA-binding protein [Virgisporangium aurantiacum]